jgi:hypothetical protein
VLTDGRPGGDHSRPPLRSAAYATMSHTHGEVADCPDDGAGVPDLVEHVGSRIGPASEERPPTVSMPPLAIKPAPISVDPRARTPAPNVGVRSDQVRTDRHRCADRR